MATKIVCVTCRYYVESEAKLWDTGIPLEWYCTNKFDFKLNEDHNPDTDGCENWEVRV